MTMTDLTGWRGLDVVDPSGEKIGRIEDIYLDDQTDAPEWLAIRTGLLGHRVSFVPVAEAQTVGDAVAVPYTKDQVEEAPHAEAEGLLSEAEEARLYEYYGLPYSDRDPETGLPAAAPGYDTATEGSDEAMTRSEEDHVSTTVPVAREEARALQGPDPEIAGRGHA